jgi:hypothetical protein
VPERLLQGGHAATGKLDALIEIAANPTWRRRRFAWGSRTRRRPARTAFTTTPRKKMLTLLTATKDIDISEAAVLAKLVLNARFGRTIEGVL